MLVYRRVGTGHHQSDTGLNFDWTEARLGIKYSDSKCPTRMDDQTQRLTLITVVHGVTLTFGEAV